MLHKQRTDLYPLNPPIWKQRHVETLTPSFYILSTSLSHQVHPQGKNGWEDDKADEGEMLGWGSLHITEQRPARRGPRPSYWELFTASTLKASPLPLPSETELLLHLMLYSFNSCRLSCYIPPHRCAVLFWIPCPWTFPNHNFSNQSLAIKMSGRVGERCGGRGGIFKKSRRREKERLSAYALICVDFFHKG